jgi:hypothetical protein
MAEIEDVYGHDESIELMKAPNSNQYPNLEAQNDNIVDLGAIYS